MNPTVLALPGGNVRQFGRASAESEVLVSVENLSKQFPVRRQLREVLLHPFAGTRTTALEGVTFQVREGEIFGLLGPNGAGKTTLFKILSTLIEPDRGRATVAGHDVVREQARVRHALTPVIPDERSLMWRLSAEENLRLYAALYGLRGKNATDRVKVLLGLVGLADTGEKMVGQFSSGMRQRLLLARGLLARPRVLLLDEPTRSLDPVSAREFREFIRSEVAGKDGRTILIATHSAEEALELCGRLAILNRGRLLAAGTAEELILQVFEDRYRIWTTAAGERAARQLARRGTVPELTAQESGQEGWNVLEVQITGGMSSASEVITTLVREGVPIGRFEQVRPSLAELIEMIVRRGGSEEPEHA